MHQISVNLQAAIDERPYQAGACESFGGVGHLPSGHRDEPAQVGEDQEGDEDHGRDLRRPLRRNLGSPQLQLRFQTFRKHRPEGSSHRLHSERALFLSNLGKVNVKALMKTTMDLSTFPDMDGRTFEGPTLFISGEKEPLWRDDAEVRRIRQLFPNSHFIKLAGASYWPHTEANKEFLMQTVAFLQTKF